MKLKFEIKDSDVVFFKELEKEQMLDLLALHIKLEDLCSTFNNGNEHESVTQEMLTKFNLLIDDIVRNTLKENNFLKRDSKYTDCDINIDNFVPTSTEIIEENVVLKFQIEIF